MTTPRYHHGCSAGSQVHRRASSSDDAIVVNANNGNVNWNNRHNRFRVRFSRRVPASECRSAEGPSLPDLIQAMRSARAGKKPSHNVLRFSLRRGRRLLRLQERITAGTWHPSKVACFVASHPKTREIHAPDIEDRIVHHLVTPRLNRYWERLFVHDSYANRLGKGIHQAVARLQTFVRRQLGAGKGKGYALKLDIKNFFPTIHRPTLWAQLKEGLQRADEPMWVQRIVHELLRRPPLSYGVQYLCTPAEREAVPPHKRLENAPPSRGLPIGNLSSQLFANIYLHALDLFVKHVLKVRHYLRYVDDFVLLADTREQLVEWQQKIEAFLAEKLKLELKPGFAVAPLSQGIDFLGYVVYGTHIRVRPRVVAHARQVMSQWERQHVNTEGMRVTPEDYRKFTSVDASYAGHFRHANSRRLSRDFERRFPWLRIARVRRRFDRRLEGKTIFIKSAKAAETKQGKFLDIAGAAA